MKTASKFSTLEPLEERIAPAAFLVTNTNDSGAGSLRQAILNANGNGNPGTVDVINFNIGGFAPYSIHLLTALPSLSEAVNANGASEPDYDGRPVIVLDGSQTVGVKGLFITGSNVTVRALTINGFDQAGIEINGAGNTVQGCFIGTDETGTVAVPNGGDGIKINSVNNIIGGDTPGERNVIAGNFLAGIRITGSSASGNIVQGNYIGTNLLGSLQIPNSQGVSITTGGNNTIGGSNPGEGNVISGNTAGDIVISTSSNNVIAGNIVGLDATAKLNLRSGSNGISILGLSDHNTIGGPLPGARNIISGHDETSGEGVFIGGGTGNIVQGNIIGTNASNDIKLGNVFGINVTSTTNTLIANNVISNNQGSGVFAINAVGLQVVNNKIGTTVNGQQDFGNGTYGIKLDGCQQPSIMGNTASGNGADGIQIYNSSNGVIQGNFLGTSASGVGVVGNGLAGVALINCGGFLVGGAGAGQGNVISGNSDNGVYIYSSVAGLITTVQGNRIGTDITGEVAVPNAGNGIWINLGNGNVIGGDQPGQGNLISGNGRAIVIQGSNTLVQGNIIGLNKDGTTAIPNVGSFGGHGVQVSGGNNNIIGGTTPGAANIIAGNAGHGVFLQNGSGNLVEGNFIGTNAVGAAGLGNAQRGVMITSSSPNSIIGGASANLANVISGNGGAGIEISGAAGAIIRGNVIGFTPNAQMALSNQIGVAVTGAATGALVRDNLIAGNTLDGLVLDGSGVSAISVLANTIGANGGAGVRLHNTTQPLAVGGGNIIAANTNGGVVLDGATHAVVTGNTIQGNQTAGVLATNGAHDNVIGGDTSAAGNTFSGNFAPGVLVASGAGNRISHNVFTGNSGLAIDLGGIGVNANDPGDADSGANGLQNAPQLTGSVLVGGSTIVAGTFNSAPNEMYRLEFYSGVSGSVAHFVGAFDVSIGTNGSTPIQFNLGPTAAGELITATATNLATGDTSEFSNVATFLPALSISDVTVMETDGPTVNAVFTVTLSAAPILPVTFNFTTMNGTATAGGDFTTTSGSITLSGSQLTATITVPVLADDLAEMAEKFTVVLSNALNVVVFDGIGEGTILNDDSTLSISANKKVATWRDLDGDLVTLRSSKPILSADDFVFLADGQGGEQLAELLLSDDGAAAARATLKLTAKRVAQSPAGDGVAHLGFLDAGGIDLKAVSVSGDLGRIEAGDASLKTAALANLTAGSIGFFGLTTQSAGGSLESEFMGKTGAIRVRGDVIGATIEASSSLGAIKIGGDLREATVYAQKSIKSLAVTGRVEGSDVLAGFTDANTAANADASIGSVRVGGDWIASRLVAGVAAGADGLFATDDDVAAGASAAFPDTTKIVSRIARIQIGGYVAGTEADDTDRFGFIAQRIGSVKISNVRLPVLPGAGNDNLAANNPLFDLGDYDDFIVREVTV
jgi:parallel beta-helix repeat protein